MSIEKAMGKSAANRKRQFTAKELARRTQLLVQARAAKAKNAEIAKLRSASNHMEACRALLGVPDDEVLYEAIAKLREENERLRQLLERTQTKFTGETFTIEGSSGGPINPCDSGLVSQITPPPSPGGPALTKWHGITQAIEEGPHNN